MICKDFIDIISNDLQLNSIFVCFFCWSMHPFQNYSKQSQPLNVFIKKNSLSETNAQLAHVVSPQMDKVNGIWRKDQKANEMSLGIKEQEWFSYIYKYFNAILRLNFNCSSLSSRMANDRSKMHFIRFCGVHLVALVSNISNIIE